MVYWIGEKVILDGTKKVVVQDVDRLAMTAKVGAPDSNDIVWDAVWVDTDRLSRQEA